jgi:hypothetical protein
VALFYEVFYFEFCLQISGQDIIEGGVGAVFTCREFGRDVTPQPCAGSLFVQSSLLTFCVCGEGAEKYAVYFGVL